MAFKVVIFCAVALLVQSISAGPVKSSGSNKSSGSCCQSISIASSGGDLVVSSEGPISPSGISVSSDLGLNGKVDVCGQLPFLTAVEFSDQYETKGSACVDYSCGDCKNIGITSVQGGSDCCCGK